MELCFDTEIWPIAGEFTISRGSKTEAVVVTVTASHKGETGRGECVPYARYGETPESVLQELQSIAAELRLPSQQSKLPNLLPAGAARNAIDCALWDLHCKLKTKRIWELTNQPSPNSVTTAFTISIGEPEKMFAEAHANAGRPLLKVKLAGENDITRIMAVAKGAPQSAIILDANEAWSPDIYRNLVPSLAALNIVAIEQPFPASDDEALTSLDRPIPIIADESVHTRAGLDSLASRYDGINIKLDKTGGLTEALLLKERAKQLNLKIMVGCMVGTSLSMAPALLLAQGADFIDLDGPLLLAKDREPGLVYQGSEIGTWPTTLWG